MFLTTWHMLLSTILTQILSRTTDLLPAVKTAQVDGTVMRNQIFPVAVLFAVSLICANRAYIYLSVSFLQMLKASTPVFVLSLTVLMGLESSSFLETSIVIIISLAVAITSIGELHFNIIGFWSQLTAIITESGRLVLTNVLLKKLKLDSLSTLYYVAPPCFCLNFLSMLIFEYSAIPWERVFTPVFVLVLLCNGLVAFALNISLVMVINHSSALSLSLAGVIKDILLVTLSMLVFKSPVSLLQCLGYAIALLALNLHRELKKLNFMVTKPVVVISPQEQQQKERDAEEKQGLLMMERGNNEGAESHHTTNDSSSSGGGRNSVNIRV